MCVCSFGKGIRNTAGLPRWNNKCFLGSMAEDILDRVNRIASSALPGCFHTTPRGESYFSFDMKDANGTVSTLPHIWIDPASSDRQIADKLNRALRESLHPQMLPDDRAVPNLKKEESGDW